MCAFGVLGLLKGIFSCTPEPHVAFCPILSTHFFPFLNPTFKNGSFLSVVALCDLPKCQTIMKVRVCVKASPTESWRVMDTQRSESPPPSPEKRSILAPTPSPPPRGLRPLTLPNVKNDAGQKQYSPCFCEGVAGRRPATPSQERGSCPPLGFQPAFLLKVQRWGFRVSGFRCFGVQGLGV